MGFDILWGETLPCMPGVLLNALEACLEEPVDMNRVVHWVKQDVVSSAHVLDSLCKTYNRRPEFRSELFALEKPLGELPKSISIELDLVDVEVDELRSWLLQLATQQISMRFDEGGWERFKKHWRRSLYSARIAKSLALLTGYQNADECYQAALLQDVGQLMQLARYNETYTSVLDSVDSDASLVNLEREKLASDHCQVAADIGDAQGWPASLTDAIRFHHEALDDIQDAQHQVKVVNIASYLSSDEFNEESDALVTIESILGIQKPLLLELLNQLRKEVDDLVAELLVSDFAVAGDDTQIRAEERVSAKVMSDSWQSVLDAQQQLAHRVSEHMHCQRLLNKVLAAGDEAELQYRWLQALCGLHNSSKGMLFVFDSELNRLDYKTEAGSKAGFSIVAEMGRSMISDAFCLRQAIAYSPEEPAERHLTVVDRQIAHQLGHRAIWVLPLMIQGHCIGVAAFSVAESELGHLQLAGSRTVAFASNISSAVPLVRQRLTAAEQGQFLLKQQYHKSIREVLHEVNNPLAIVSNYLQTIRFKRPDDTDVQTDIEKISGELRRASALLEKLKSPADETVDEAVSSEIGKVITVTAELIEQGLLDDKGISLALDVDESLAGFQIRQLPLQQILTNLLKNASEVLKPGGVIKLRAKPMQSDGQHRYVALDVIDDGPGLPDQVQRRLFQSVASTKAGHAGLGLQIVKRLVDDLHGMIFCRSTTAGTHFQILLPVFFHSSTNEDENPMGLNNG